MKKLLKMFKNKKFSPYSLYGLAIFVGSFLLFSIQPLIGKKILPWFGGFSSVWTTLMVFFLTTLFLGYLYTVWLSKQNVKKQKKIHLILIIASTLAIVFNYLLNQSLIPQLDLSANTNPIFGLLVTSILALGLPYFLLSTTSTLLQTWYAKVEGNNSTYSLYQISNIGSLLGLLSYPFLIEPYLTISQQENTWTISFIFFALLLMYTTYNSGQKNLKDKLSNLSISKISWIPFLAWVFISTISNTVLLSLTSQLTQGLPPVVFLWIFPLGLYLLSYVIAFSNKDWYAPKFHVTLMFVTTVLTFAFMVGLINVPLVWTIIVSLINSFLIFLIAHRELFVNKPQTSGIPLFYLAIALGGVIASVFCSMLAPLIFSEFWEFPLSLSAAIVLGLEVLWKEEDGIIKKVQFGILAFLIIMFISYSFSKAHNDSSNVILAKRNFYGILKVTSNYNGADKIHALINGVISHGTQYMSGVNMYTPTTYYTRESGVGISIEKNPKRISGQKMRIGVVGLGAGTIAAYCQTGDYIRFYEINPDVIEISEEYFGYIKHCRDIGGTVDIILGDARLSLQDEIDRGEPQNFDVLALDAFSDDMIPTHLMTKEATELYFKHLSNDGVVAFHISNKFLNLNRVLATMVEELKLPAYEYNVGSHWFMVSPKPVNLPFTPFDPYYFNDKIEKMWTDNYSNILPIVIGLNK